MSDSIIKEVVERLRESGQGPLFVSEVNKEPPALVSEPPPPQRWVGRRRASTASKEAPR